MPELPERFPLPKFTYIRNSDIAKKSPTRKADLVDSAFTVPIGIYRGRILSVALLPGNIYTALIEELKDLRKIVHGTE